MTFLELAKRRYSSRNYQDKPVEKELLLQVMEAGRVAPSAKNNQPWHFVALTEPLFERRTVPGETPQAKNINHRIYIKYF